MDAINQPAPVGERASAVIAIVDDDLSVLKAMDNLLSALGYSVSTFETAQTFLLSCAFEHPACLIADVEMPEISGIELLRQLNRTGLAVPTIFMTAFPKEISRAKALSAGAIDFLEKPVRQEDLIRSLQGALSGENHAIPRGLLGDTERLGKDFPAPPLARVELGTRRSEK